MYAYIYHTYIYTNEASSTNGPILSAPAHSKQSENSPLIPLTKTYPCTDSKCFRGQWMKRFFSFPILELTITLSNGLIWRGDMRSPGKQKTPIFCNHQKSWRCTCGVEIHTFCVGIKMNENLSPLTEGCTHINFIIIWSWGCFFYIPRGNYNNLFYCNIVFVRRVVCSSREHICTYF